MPVESIDEKQSKLNESIAMLNLEYGTPKGKKVIVAAKDKWDDMMEELNETDKDN